MALIPGVKVNLRGREFTIPPLTLDAYERFSDRIDALGTSKTSEAMATMREVVHAALVDNHPEVTVEDLKKLLDMGNIGPTFQAVLARTAEGKPEGEVKTP